MAMFKIVRTDNFNGDYPDEKFVEHLPMLLDQEQAEHICKAINEVAYKQQGYNHPHHWRVVPYDYVLVPGFEA